MIRVVPETGSTNADLAAELAHGERVPEGDWLVADRQLAGYGRQGRAWLDGAGNFMGSTVVHLRPGDPAAHGLSLVAGVALHAALAEFAAGTADVRLKWPNDATVGAAKLAGILLERQGDAVVVGVGVNLLNAPEVPGRTTIALAGLGQMVSRDAFAAALADRFAQSVATWREFGLAAMIPRWLARAHPKGTLLQVGEPGEAPLEGRFGGLDDEGALILLLTDGTTRMIHAGEVRLAAPS